ncbi:MAG: hypothetical protein ACKPKO_57815, partial [Candidatus Fonsibacter sp.]
VAWHQACDLIQIVDPSVLSALVISLDLAPEPPPPVHPERAGVPNTDIGASADSVPVLTSASTDIFEFINVRHSFHDHLHRFIQDLHMILGKSMTLGLCNDGDYPSITNDTLGYLRTVMKMNEQAIDVVHEAQLSRYRWNSMFVTYVNDKIDIPGK